MVVYMYIHTEALVFLFNGGSSYSFTSHVDSVYANHINNEKLMHHGFLAPQAYLCSTSLKCSSHWFCVKMNVTYVLVILSLFPHHIEMLCPAWKTNASPL